MFQQRSTISNTVPTIWRSAHGWALFQTRGAQIPLQPTNHPSKVSTSFMYSISLHCCVNCNLHFPSHSSSPIVKFGASIVRPSHCGLFMKYLGIASKLGIDLQSSLNTDISSKNSKKFSLNTTVLSCVEMQTTNYRIRCDFNYWLPHSLILN